MELGPYLGQPLLDSEALHAVTVNASFRYPFKLPESQIRVNFVMETTINCIQTYTALILSYVVVSLARTIVEKDN